MELEEGVIWSRRASGRGGEVEGNGNGNGKESLRGLDGAGLVNAKATGIENGQIRGTVIGAREVDESEGAKNKSVSVNVSAKKKTTKEMAPCAWGLEKGIASIVVVTDPAAV